MHNPRLAGRYAKSLLDLAIEKNQLEPVYEDMLYLKSLFGSSREFTMLLKSPVLSGDRKKKILEALTGNKFGPLTKGFCNLLVDKGREAFLPEMVDAFIGQYKDYKGIHVVTLTTAQPLSDELRDAIVAKFKADAGLGQVELKSVVNEDIIGGFVLETGGRLVDASIAYDLGVIKKQFSNNDFIYKIR